LQATKKPIDQLLINCLFKNCVANQGYIIPLGLNPGKTGSSVIHNLIHIKKKDILQGLFGLIIAMRPNLNKKPGL